MSHYQSPEDLQHITSLSNLAPREVKAFINYDQIVKRDDGQIPRKIREFISLAVALTTQCSYCIDVHTKAAQNVGATKEELAELISIAAAVRAGATIGHGLLALRLFDEKAC